MPGTAGRRLHPVVALWELWPGQNRFLLNGTLMVGPSSDNPWPVCTYAFLIVVPLFTIASTAAYLWKEVSPAVPIVSSCLWLVTLSLAAATTLTDPGIIPREEVFQLLGGVPAEFSTPRRARCRTCQVVKPEFSHHCRRCDDAQDTR